MNAMQRGMYSGFVNGLRVVRRLACRRRVWGRERIPPGVKIYVTNHISSTDPWYMLPVFTEPVHAVVGAGFEMPVMGWVLERFEQINALEAHRSTVLDKAQTFLKRGEPIWITPEGNIYPDGVMRPFYPGVAKIYRRSPVPIVPIAMVAPQRAMAFKGSFLLGDYFCINVGHPMTPEIREDVDEAEDNQRIVHEIQSAVQGLIDEVRAKRLWKE